MTGDECQCRGCQSEGAMTDYDELVERLRDPAFPPKPAGDMALRLSAADAIASLQRELATERGIAFMHRRRAEQAEAERDALQRERDELHHMNQKYVEMITASRAENEKLTKLVRNAYNEGFSEGMREHTSSRGGKTWHDSDARAALADTPAPSPVQPGGDASVDAIAREICAETCAFMGELPCYQIRDDKNRPLPWPNPNCDSPGCQALAARVAGICARAAEAAGELG